MKRILRGAAAVVALTGLAACDGSDDEPEMVPEAPAAVSPATSDGMEGMEGMGAAAGADTAGLPSELQAHMRMMQGASGEELARMIPEHRQLVANMIARMNREMRDMGMTSSAEWNETVEALRDDLVRLPEMTGEEIRAYLPAHQARLERLTEMHRSMMKNMRM